MVNNGCRDAFFFFFEILLFFTGSYRRVLSYFRHFGGNFDIFRWTQISILKLWIDKMRYFNWRPWSIPWRVQGPLFFLIEPNVFWKFSCCLRGFYIDRRCFYWNHYFAGRDDQNFTDPSFLITRVHSFVPRKTWAIGRKGRSGKRMIFKG